MSNAKYFPINLRLFVVLASFLSLGLFGPIVEGQAQSTVHTEDAAIESNELPNANHKIFLPVIVKSARWERVNAQGTSPINISTVTVAKNYIAAGDQRDINQGGGVYKAKLQCTSSTTFTLIQHAVASQVKLYEDSSIYYGVAGSYGQKSFYTNPDDPNGNDWQQTTSNISINVYSIEKSNLDHEFYAGAGSGILKSIDSGATWTTISSTLNSAITLVQQNKTVWVGTFSSGILQLSLNDNNKDQITQYQFQPENKRIWDFAFYNFGTNKPNLILIATGNGVYHRNLNDQAQWIVTGLQGKEIYTLVVQKRNNAISVDDRLYAGILGGGVQSIALTDLQNGSPPFTWRVESAGNGWNPNYSVRDLLYVDEGACTGLLAATNDGVWILR